jgi:hypothetical protein
MWVLRRALGNPSIPVHPKKSVADQAQYASHGGTWLDELLGGRQFISYKLEYHARRTLVEDAATERSSRS